MKRKLAFVIFLLSIIIIQFILLLTPKKTQLLVKNDLKQQVKSVITHSVFVGKNKFNLYGYTSPQSEVFLNGQGINANGISDETGYFEFKGVFSPLSKREVCLYSVDNYGRRTHPTCLAPFPIDYNAIIGSIILAPSISINNNNFIIGNNIVVSGQTIPNSQVTISLYSQRDNYILRSDKASDKSTKGIKLPEINTKSDNKGNYSISFPGNKNQRLRVVSASFYENSASPPSNSLTINIYSLFWSIILAIFSNLSRFIDFITLLIIIIEISLLSYLISPLLNKYKHGSKADLIKKNTNFIR